MPEAESETNIVFAFVLHTVPLSIVFLLCLIPAFYLVEEVHPAVGIVSLVGVYAVTQGCNNWWSEYLRNRGYDHV